jgi:hypothetical protein
MNDALKPEWIKLKKSQIELAVAKSEAATQRAIATSLRIDAEWPEFLRQLLLELTVNTDALPEIGVRGRTSNLTSPEGGEVRYRVEVAERGSLPGMTHTDLFYMPSDSRIRCRTMEGDTFDFTFCILPTNKIAVMPYDEFVPVNAKKMAETIVEKMVETIRDGS